MCCNSSVLIRDKAAAASSPRSANLVQKKRPRPPELSWKEGSFLFLSEGPFFSDKAACSEYRYVMKPYFSPLSNQRKNSRCDQPHSPCDTALHPWPIILPLLHATDALGSLDTLNVLDQSTKTEGWADPGH